MAEADAAWEPDIERQRRYDGVSIAFHWLTLALLLVLFASMWALHGTDDENTADTLLLVHRSAGVLVWITTLSRLAWKMTAARAPGLPSTLPIAQQWLARANQCLLYILLIAQPVTGFVQSIARGKPFTLLGGTVPAMVSRNKPLVHLFENIHSTTATLLLVIVGLHALAALFHGLFRRDGVMSSMIPGASAPHEKNSQAWGINPRVGRSSSMTPTTGKFDD